MGEVERQLDTFLCKTPALGQGVYIARSAVVLGDVTLGDGSSVWCHTVLRGDINRIAVGRGSNIQDQAVLHVAEELPCLVGDWVTVGHSAVVHACTVGDEVLVGMGSVLLDGATVGEQSIIGARALVTQHTQIPPGSLVLGVPARVVRALTPEERGRIKSMAGKYAAMAAFYLSRGIH